MAIFVRSFALTLAALAASILSAASAQAQGTEVLKVTGQLSDTDTRDTVQKESFRKIHLLRMTAGKKYVIDLKSEAFDSYLRLEDSAGKQIASDDDTGGNFNARIEVTAATTGSHRVIVTSVGAGTGKYELTAVESGSGDASNPPVAGGDLKFSNGRASTESKLSNDDEKDNVRVGAFRKVYKLKLAEGKEYQIDMISSNFDAYLRLETSDGRQIAADDDGGGNLNARIRMRMPATDEYRIIATSLFPNRTGAFSLQVSEGGAGAAAAVVQKLELKDGKASQEGGLANDDEKDTVRQGSFRKVYRVKLTEGKDCQIDLISNDFDAYLRLETSGGRQIVADDDSGGGLHSRIRMRVPATDEYRIIATSLGAGMGNFSLKVAEGSALMQKLELKDGSAEATNALYNNDTRDTKRNQACKIHTLKLTEGKTYQIDMVSGAFDSYLRLENSEGTELAADDDGGGGLNARIMFNCPATAEYRIIATSFRSGVGDYTLTVRERD